MNVLESAPSDLERPEQWLEVCQQGIFPDFLTHATAITGKIDKHKFINVLGDPEDPDPQ